jgi:hypothetical protein
VARGRSIVLYNSFSGIYCFNRIVCLGFARVKWRSRQGLAVAWDNPEAQQLGVSGEKDSDWYLRLHGLYLHCAKRHALRPKGGLDLVGFDGRLSRWWKFAAARELSLTKER